jgi:UDP-N-acetyl-D-mannosaminuronate dehydrogenase
MVLHKVTKINHKLVQQNKPPKEIKWLVLGLNYKINIQLLQSILLKQREMFQNLMIKIVVPTSSEMMPKLFQCMSFVKNMEIDLNNKTIDFYEFPS